MIKKTKMKKTIKIKIKQKANLISLPQITISIKWLCLINMRNMVTKRR